MIDRRIAIGWLTLSLLGWLVVGLLAFGISLLWEERMLLLAMLITLPPAYPDRRPSWNSADAARHPSGHLADRHQGPREERSEPYGCKWERIEIDA